MTPWIHNEDEPAADDAAGAISPSPDAADTGDTAAGLAPRRATILVAEDDRTLRDLLARVLDGLQCRALIAADAAAAVRLADDADGAIDLLITDIQMPGETGAELARRLRRRWPALPVIFVSGSADPRDLAGANSVFLAKPYSVAQLSAAIDQLLGPADG